MITGRQVSRFRRRAGQRKRFYRLRAVMLKIELEGSRGKHDWIFQYLEDVTQMLFSLRHVARERWRNGGDVTGRDDGPEPANAVFVSIEMEKNDPIRPHARDHADMGGILVDTLQKLSVAYTLWRLLGISAVKADSRVVTSALSTDLVEILHPHRSVDLLHFLVRTGGLVAVREP